MGLVILSACLVILIIAIILFIKAHKRNVSLNQVEEKKERLQQAVEDLVNQYKNQTKNLNDVKDLIKSSQNQIQYINRTINEKQQEHKKILKDIEEQKQKANNFYNQEKQIVEKQLDEFKKITSKAAENYFDNLQEAYRAADAAHAEKLTRLKEEQDSAAASLTQLKETRKAAQEALLKQQEIKENKDNYRLKLNRQDLQDVSTLEQLRNTFHKPRVISMLIWQYYFQPIAKRQFPIILQSDTKTGIYKITNTLKDKSYIGQSVDIYKRWMDHCKAGLGIDTPAGNKLYQAMLSDGLQNFTFELLCQCSNLELNEKVRYFIELYQADLYGYNGTKGNK